MYANCWDNPICGTEVCYQPSAGEMCLLLSDPGLPAKLGCMPEFAYESPKPDGSCCYGYACPGGRPLVIEAAPVRAAVARRDDWG